MKKAFYFVAALCLMLLAVSCEDSGGSYPPTWKGFTYEPSTVHPGDSVTITAVQAKKGKYLYTVTYNFSMRVYVEVDGVTQDSTLAYSYKTNYDGTDNGDPQWKLKLPDNTVPTSYPCTFTARWDNYADGRGGSYQCTGGDGCTGSIASQSYTLYSTASGSFTLPIAR